MKLKFIYTYLLFQDKKAEKIEDEKFVLTDGLLLLMNPPTNNYWYHSLPPRKSCKETRYNFDYLS